MMSDFQIFFDGMALGFLLGFALFCLLYIYMPSRRKEPESEVDRLVSDIQSHYRSASEQEDKERD